MSKHNTLWPMESHEIALAGEDRALEVQRAVDNISTFIAEIVGEETAASLDITPQSRMLLDLGMDSLELVSLADRINQQYGAEADFHAWLARTPIKRIMVMSIGDVAEIVADAVARERGATA